jgi:hypothetical protein
MVGAPPVGGLGSAGKRIDQQHQPRTHTLRRLVAATSTSHTTGTLGEIIFEINVYKIIRC